MTGKKAAVLGIYSTRAAAENAASSMASQAFPVAERVGWRGGSVARGQAARQDAFYRVHRPQGSIDSLENAEPRFSVRYDARPLNCFDASFRSFVKRVLPDANRRGLAGFGAYRYPCIASHCLRFASGFADKVAGTPTVSAISRMNWRIKTRPNRGFDGEARRFGVLAVGFNRMSVISPRDPSAAIHLQRSLRPVPRLRRAAWRPATRKLGSYRGAERAVRFQ